MCVNVKTVKVQLRSTKTSYCLLCRSSRMQTKLLITVYPGPIGRASASYITWEVIYIFSRENFNLTVFMEIMLLDNSDLPWLPIHDTNPYMILTHT